MIKYEVILTDTQGTHNTAPLGWWDASFLANYYEGKGYITELRPIFVEDEVSEVEDGNLDNG
jgi:hypothetical protein